MPPRSRSSTVTSTSSAAREPVATNPDELVAPTSSSSRPAPTDDRRFSPFAPPSEAHFDGPKSYASEHSLRTIRPHAPDSGDDDEGQEGDGPASVGGNGHGASTWQQRGRRAGPQFVIDLEAGTPTDEQGASSFGGGGNRPRSSTFGGVELPPAPSANALLEPVDRDADATTTTDTAGAGMTPRPNLSRHRSTSLSSLSSLRSLDPSLHLGGAPLHERRPMLYAGLQAGALLLASVLGLWLVLKGLLPPIDPEHQDKVKLPKSFDDLKSLNEVLQVREDRPLRVVGTRGADSFAVSVLALGRSTASATTGASSAATLSSTSCAPRGISLSAGVRAHELTTGSLSRAASRPSPSPDPCTCRFLAARCGAC